jgi:hypothetical protein
VQLGVCCLLSMTLGARDGVVMELDSRVAFDYYGVGDLSFVIQQLQRCVRVGVSFLDTRVISVYMVLLITDLWIPSRLRHGSARGDANVVRT